MQGTFGQIYNARQPNRDLQALNASRTQSPELTISYEQTRFSEQVLGHFQVEKAVKATHVHESFMVSRLHVRVSALMSLHIDRLSLSTRRGSYRAAQERSPLLRAARSRKHSSQLDVSTGHRDVGLAPARDLGCIVGARSVG